MISDFTAVHCHRAERRALLLLSMVVVAAVVGACQKVPLLAPTSSTITIYTNALTIPLNGSAVITASVIESAGTPVQNGTTVIFTTNLGTLNPVQATTVNGQATTTLTAGTQSGTASVSANSGSAVAEKVDILVGGAAASQVVLSATPAILPVGGGNTTLVATVTDATGNPVPGLPVTFSVDAGTLDAGTELTNSSGRASVRLTTTVDANATATAAGKASTSVKVTVTQPDVFVPPTITLSATAGTGSTALFTGQTVGFTANVTAGTVTKPGSTATQIPVENVAVNYGDGSSSSLGAVTGQTAVAHVYSRAGTYTVSATVRDTAGQQTTATTIIIVSDRPPLSVTVTASPSNPTVGTTVVSLTVNVTFATGTGVDHVSWDFGDGNSAQTSGLSTAHVYSTLGRLVIKVTVFATDGTSGFAQTEIVVITP